MGICEERRFLATAVAYYEALNKVSKKLVLRLSNNHVFRMALNSYVYVPMGVPITERAKLLGHSVDTNLKHYTFARSDEYLNELGEMINTFNAKERVTESDNEKETLKLSTSKQEKRALKPRISKLFS